MDKLDSNLTEVYTVYKTLVGIVCRVIIGNLSESSGLTSTRKIPFLKKAELVVGVTIATMSEGAPLAKMGDNLE